MAAAEARAAWQRAANRCLVQEDAKRAPKLACCQSSSAQLQDSNCGNATTGQHKCISNFVPLNWNHMSSNLPPDTKWWLQRPTNFPSQKDLIFEQKTSKNKPGEFEEATNKASFEGSIPSVNMKGCSLESSWIMPEISIERDSATQLQDMKAVTSICPQQTVETEEDQGACCFQSELLNLKPFDSLPSHKADESCFDFNFPWEGISKCEPWWRISDKGELASLVAQKSLQNIENCDLPKPAHTSRSPFYCHESWEGNRSFTSQGCNLDAGMCHPVGYPPHDLTLKDTNGRYWLSDRAHGSTCEDEKFGSTTAANPFSVEHSSESDPSRSELLEALCHSQTRARKAEMEAQKAYDEKEHIVKLLFRQASHLFAYKQWLQMLQLESICLQLRIKDHQISTIFPVLPWMPLRGKPMAKHRSEMKRKGRKQKKCSLCRYAFILAVGLGLAGAGFLLGYCLGWLSPP